MSQQLVLEAASKHTASVIFVHGLGDSGYGWLPFAQELRPNFKHVKWILPNAPQMPVSAAMGSVMPAWFDLYQMPGNFDPSAPRKEDEEGILKSVSRVIDYVNAEINSGIPPERIVVGGFSQGGALSLLTGLTIGKKIAGVCCLSGFVTLADKVKDLVKEPGLSQNIFWGHGTADPIVTLQRAEAGLKTLQSLGAKIDYKTYPNMVHTLGEKEQSDVEAWLAKAIPETLPKSEL